MIKKPQGSVFSHVTVWRGFFFLFFFTQFMNVMCSFQSKYHRLAYNKCSMGSITVQLSCDASDIRTTVKFNLSHSRLLGLLQLLSVKLSYRWSETSCLLISCLITPQPWTICRRQTFIFFFHTDSKNTDDRQKGSKRISFNQKNKSTRKNESEIKKKKALHH